MLLDAKLPREDFASVVSFRCGSAPLDPALADEFRDYFGIPCLVNYGATEFAGGASGWTMEDYKQFGKAKRGSVGRLNPGIQGRTVDPETGAPLPPGQVGLLELKAPHLGNGRDWLRTTDLAIVDEDSFLFIKGRADNAIIRGGFKVAPDDVVRALEAHPAIREAAVIGMPDPRLGQVPVAALLLKDGATYPGDAAIVEFLKKTLTPYQVPVRFTVLESLPRTGAMKVDQTSLRRILAGEAA
jgi:acyl-CoA synthetase (AMP-forming)/AMP-acid ligase II